MLLLCESAHRPPDWPYRVSAWLSPRSCNRWQVSAMDFRLIPRHQRRFHPTPATQGDEVAHVLPRQRPINALILEEIAFCRADSPAQQHFATHRCEQPFGSQGEAVVGCGWQRSTGSTNGRGSSRSGAEAGGGKTGSVNAGCTGILPGGGLP